MGGTGGWGREGSRGVPPPLSLPWHSLQPLCLVWDSRSWQTGGPVLAAPGDPPRVLITLLPPGPFPPRTGGDFCLAHLCVVPCPRFPSPLPWNQFPISDSCVLIHRVICFLVGLQLNTCPVNISGREMGQRGCHGRGKSGTGSPQPLPALPLPRGGCRVHAGGCSCPALSTDRFMLIHSHGTVSHFAVIELFSQLGTGLGG